MPPRPRTVPRKSPRQERSRATVDAILAATARVLVRDGYDRASTNRVAETAGVSVGSLYQYFPSKEALVAALVERHMEAMSDVIARAVGAVVAAPMHVAVRAVIRAMIDAHRVDPVLHRVFIEQVPRVGRLQRLNDVQARMQAMIRAHLETRRDELRQADLDLAVFVVVRAVEAVTHAVVLDHPSYLNDERLVDAVSDLVLRFLAKDPGTAAAGAG